MRASIIIAALSLAGAAQGQQIGEKRYTTIFEEYVDGQKRPSSVLETALISKMIADGATFVDESQSRKIRASLTASDVLRGAAVSDIITAQDADVIVAGVVRADRANVGSALQGKVVRYQATADVRLISVDNGQILDSLLVSSPGVHQTMAGAIESALQATAEALAKKMSEKSTIAQGRRVELVVDGLPEISAAGRMREALLGVPGIVRVDVPVSSTREATKLVLVLGDRALPTPELVRAIEAASIGIRVKTHSGSLIHAEYASSRAARVPIVFGRFERRGAGSDRAAIETADLIGRVLLDLRFLEPLKEGTPIDLGRTNGAREKRLRDLGAELALTGWFADRGSVRDIEAEVRSVSDDLRVLVRDRVSCPIDQLATCTADVARRLSAVLPGALSESRSDAFAGARPISIRSVSLEDVFPARAQGYRTRGEGEIAIENAGATKAQVQVRASIEGWTSETKEREAIEIGPHSTVKVPIMFSLDEHRISQQDANRTALLKLEVLSSVGNRKQTTSRAVTINMLDKNALDWRRPASVGAFVTAQSTAVKRLATAATSAIPADLADEPFAFAAAHYHAIGNLSYQPDAVQPGRGNEIDQVQSAAETLERGQGDCDDLAVLLASLAESSGTKTLLVLTPGHVIVAIDSVPSQNARALSLDPTRVLIHAGRAWIPVETTRPSATFAEAWEEGARVIARAKREGDELEIIDIRAAWSEYPPLNFGSATSPRIPSFARLAAELAELTQRSDAQRRAVLDAIEAKERENEATANELNEKGLILASVGRFEDARTALLRAIELSPAPRDATNNLGNIELVLGSPADALKQYVHAIAQAGDAEQKLRIHLNAAVAARILGDDRTFAAHVSEALASATTPQTMAIITYFLESLGGSGPSFVQGDRADALDQRGLAKSLQKIVEKRWLEKRPRSGVRAREWDSRVHSEIAQVLFWLGVEAT